MSGLDFIAQAVAHLESVGDKGKGEKLKVSPPVASPCGLQPRIVSDGSVFDESNSVPAAAAASSTSGCGPKGTTSVVKPTANSSSSSSSSNTSVTVATAGSGIIGTVAVGMPAVASLPHSSHLRQLVPGQQQDTMGTSGTNGASFQPAPMVNQDYHQTVRAEQTRRGSYSSGAALLLPPQASKLQKKTTSAQRKQQPAFPPAAGEGESREVAAMLAKISKVMNNLEVFFACMEKLCQEAVAIGGTPSEVPKPDELIQQVQRNDVLLGRGGETNHHIGNIRYRQLVKACQCAYLAAKRRDKPRIAAAIVQVVRARSGRFLKKKPCVENTWTDVGSTRAREKTSQALREGAPELRGRVSIPLSGSHQETVHQQRQNFPNNSLPNSMPMTMIGAPPPPPYYHHPQVTLGVPVYGHHALPPRPAIAVTAEASSQPPKKRTISQAQKTDTAVSAATTTARAHNFLPQQQAPPRKEAMALVPANISAEDESEEERARSPSSASSSKSANRGPRMKLLKQRMRDETQD